MKSRERIKLVGTNLPEDFNKPIIDNLSDCARLKSKYRKLVAAAKHFEALDESSGSPDWRKVAFCLAELSLLGFKLQGAAGRKRKMSKHEGAYFAAKVAEVMVDKNISHEKAAKEVSTTSKWGTSPVARNSGEALKKQNQRADNDSKAQADQSRQKIITKNTEIEAIRNAIPPDASEEVRQLAITKMNQLYGETDEPWVDRIGLVEVYKRELAKQKAGGRSILIELNEEIMANDK